MDWRGLLLGMPRNGHGDSGGSSESDLTTADIVNIREHLREKVRSPIVSEDLRRKKEAELEEGSKAVGESAAQCRKTLSSLRDALRPKTNGNGNGRCKPED